MQKRSLLFLLSWVLALVAYAQVTTQPSPIPVGYDGQVIIIFDPTAGNGGMASATKCYAHTGLITADSKSNSDWKYATRTWRGADSPQLTATGDGRWQLTIDNIFSFYGCPSTTDIKALAFVFHDGPGGNKEGKTASGGDILVFLGEESHGDIWEGFTPAAVVEQARPAGVVNGIYYDADGRGVTLCTYAASKTEPAKHVFLLGDMTDWRLSNDYQLRRDGNYFWIHLSGLEPGREYRFQYAIERADGVKKQISDLYSEKVLHPDDAYEPSKVDPALIGYPLKGADGGYVTVIQPGKPAFPWSDATLHFTRPDKNNLLIYELWVYDYTADRSLKGVLEQLDYIASLGVNAIELMPVCEFDGNYNWGYSPNHYFALDKAYGTPEMMKTLVDECHKRGIAVILDMVFNHATGLNPMNKLYPYGADLSKNPFFNVTAPHGDNVYEDWNHGFEPAHEMFVRALNYWLDEYKVDGYRMDLSHGLCSNVANTSVQNITDYWNRAIQPHGAYFILEHWGNNMGSERPQLVNLGCMCWNNTSNAYCQTAMGWLKDGDSFASSNSDNYVSYTCSHDEERPFYKAKTYGNGPIKSDEATRNRRIAANVVMNVLLDGPHMIWQFEELGYDFSINSSADAPSASSSDNRCSKKPRPETYGYFTDPLRTAQRERIGQACQLRTRLMPEVFVGNPTAVSLGSGKAIRTIQWGNDVFVVANLAEATTGPQSVILPSGTWYDYLDDPTATATSCSLRPGDVKVYTSRPISADLDLVVTDAPLGTKTLRNGQLLIVRDGVTYDLFGRRL